ncbi:MAG TPA: hypothetical protein IGR64_12530 [Leptolyngbyaceae cyanobacterium M65_K2018_010]|nr:hypothetical protein [Leptolyngbyaceae cyanobacterium M65_K2018_010]
MMLELRHLTACLGGSGVDTQDPLMAGLPLPRYPRTLPPLPPVLAKEEGHTVYQNK